jgi:hypothetical protein
VKITDPEDGHWFKEGDEITPDIWVESCGSDLRGVWAEITVSDGLFIDGDFIRPTQNLSAGVPVDLPDLFHIRCVDGTGPATYTVTMWGQNYANVTRRNHDTHTANQFTDDPELSVTIDSPQTSNWYSPGETFVVTATVTAAGGYRPPVWSPVVTLTVDAGNAEILTDPVIELEDLDPGESVVVAWEVRCTGPCDVDISVEVTGVNPWCTKGLVVGPDSDSITVHQFPLKATIFQYPNEVESGATFGIHAKIGFDDGACDECQKDCEDCGISDVWATIEIVEGPARLEENEVDTKPLSEVLCPEKFTQDAEWTLKCMGPGTVKVRVKAWTTKNPDTGEDLGKELFVWSDIVAIRQIPRLVGYDFQLCKHWNYMSLPLIPPTTAIADVLKSLEDMYVEIWAYDPGMGWSVYAPGKPPGWYTVPMLTTVDHGKGYIIRMAWPEVFEYEGYDWPPPGPASEPPVYDLYQQWNLVGYTTLGANRLQSMDAGDYLWSMNTGGQLDPNAVVGDEARMLRTYVCGYLGQWDELTDDADDMQVGQSYWVYASIPGLAIVPPLD